MNLFALQEDIEQTSSPLLGSNRNSRKGRGGGSSSPGSSHGGRPAKAMVLDADGRYVPRDVDSWNSGPELSADQRLRHKYEITEEVIGKGGYGTVVKGTRRTSGKPVAIKRIAKKKVSSRGLSALLGEVETMSMLNHNFIVRLEDVYHDPNNLFIVMEYVPGGELAGVVKRSGGKLPESTVQRISLSLLFALDYIHSKGIVHRDMKLSNCLVSDVSFRPPSDDAIIAAKKSDSFAQASAKSSEFELTESLRGDPIINIKIADFGFGVLVGNEPCLTSFCGTTSYMAPEVLSRREIRYGKPVDLWSLGVMTFVMLSGEYPFQGSSSRLTDAICNGTYEFNAATWDNISPAAKDFVSKLLVVDPTRRATAAEALMHPWIRAATDLNDEDFRQQIALDQRFEQSSESESDHVTDEKMTPRTPRIQASSGKISSPRQANTLKRQRLRSRFRVAVSCVLAMNRLIFLMKLQVLKRDGADIPILRSFSYLVGRRYDPPTHSISASRICHQNPKALQLVADMLESSKTIETFDVSHNGIDNVDLVQRIVRLSTTHPSLTSLNLEANPIPPLAGRALLRLSRSALRLRSLNVEGTLVGQDVIQQIAQNIRDNEWKRRVDNAMSAVAMSSPAASPKAKTQQGFLSLRHSVTAPTSGAPTNFNATPSSPPRPTTQHQTHIPLKTVTVAPKTVMFPEGRPHPASTPTGSFATLQRSVGSPTNTANQKRSVPQASTPNPSFSGSLPPIGAQQHSASPTANIPSPPGHFSPTRKSNGNLR